MKGSALLFLIVGIFMLGIVSAVDMNYASSLNGASATGSLTGHGSNYITDNWYNSNVNNGINENLGNYYGGGRYADGRPIYLTYTIEFEKPAEVINSIIIDYALKAHRDDQNRYRHLVEIYDGSTWTKISEYTGTAGPMDYLPELDTANKPSSLVGQSRQKIIGGGSWNDVEKIRIYLFSDGTDNSNYAAIFNVQAIGLEPIVETCSDGIQNQDETGVDCGGVCSACLSINSCSSPDQTIMKLYSPTNSHGALWNDTNGYNYDICYDEIFGGSGNGNHDCAQESDAIIWLSDTYNAHVSVVGSFADPVYNIPICYGDLSCYSINESAGESCNVGEEIIASLYQEDNSHISNASDTDYPIKICCSFGSQVRWENMDGVPITEADLGDTVRMVQTNTASGDFEIKEGDVGWFNGDDDIRVGLNNISGVVDENGNLIGLWKITQDDLDETNDYGNFYFKVNDETSDDLNIFDSYDDDPMVIMLESPFCGQNFTVDDITEIKINASDPDNLITGNVTINGEVWNFSNEGISFDYTWNNSGNIQVELFAMNDRGYLRRTITSVMVVKLGVTRDYVAACIDKPADFSDITSSNVLFDARSSAGLRCITPSGLSVGEGCTPVDKTGLWFSWRFSDGLINFNHDGGALNSDGSPNELAYKFHKNFATAGHNWAILDVEMM